LCSTCTGTETNEQTMKERPERFRVDGPSNVLAEQQQQTRLQHEGTQNKITNVVSPPGAMPIPAYAHQSPGQWFTVQSPPMLWINPYMVPMPNWNHCCRKHQQYCSRLDRRGRPPHDDGCPFKIRNTNSILK